MATGMQQISENLRIATCSLLNPAPTRTTSTVPGAMEITKAFSDMSMANCVQSAASGHNWFGNRAGAQEQFDALRKAALDPDFKGNDSFGLQQVEQLRGLLRNQNYDAQQAKALVTGLVNHATMLANPTGSPIPDADRNELNRIIEQTAPPASSTDGTRAAPPSRAPAARPPN